MKYVIRLVGTVAGEIDDDSTLVPGYDGLPVYVSAFDPDAHGGRGEVHSTPDPEEAKQFDDQHDAVMYYLQQSRVRPRRLDGKANRPLTVFTVSIEQVSSSHLNA